MFCAGFVLTPQHGNTISRNNLEYCYTQMSGTFEGIGHAPNKYIAKSIESVLNAAADDPDNTDDLCVVILEGTIHRFYRVSLYNFIKDQYKGEVLLGHILDRGDQYYELHPQSFLISLSWWDSIGRPSFDVGKQNSPQTLMKPERSAENYHDHYTPIWVKGSTESAEYSGTRFGWNIIQAALQSDTGVGVFNRELRDSRGFMYTNNFNAYVDNIKHVLSPFETKFYVHNTEVFDPPTGREHNEVDIIFAPASGLSGISLAKIKNLRKGGKLVIFDISFPSLYMTEKIFSFWDGRNYSKFIQSLIGMEPEFIKDYLTATESSWDGTHDQEDFVPWFDAYFKTYHIEYISLNLFNINQVRHALTRHDVKGKRCYFHCTNAFEFLPTSQLFDARTRAEVISRLKSVFHEIEVSHNLGFLDEKLKVCAEAFDAADRAD